MGDKRQDRPDENASKKAQDAKAKPRKSVAESAEEGAGYAVSMGDSFISGEGARWVGNGRHDVTNRSKSILDEDQDQEEGK